MNKNLLNDFSPHNYKRQWFICILFLSIELISILYWYYTNPKGRNYVMLTVKTLEKAQKEIACLNNRKNILLNELYTWQNSSILQEEKARTVLHYALPEEIIFFIN